MKLPLKWAQSFADIKTTPQEFADRMTMTGSKVETYESEADHMQNVVLGRVETLEKHPDSDHLWVCQVNVGSETVQIITGAQNLKTGDICPTALHGAKLPNGAEIRRGKLRGLVSNGMLCSLDELGLTLHDYPNAVEDGILVLREDELPEGWALGDNAAAALGMDDVVFEFEITPNRPDCLSVRGLAREAAATYNVPLHEHVPAFPAGEGDVNELLKARIDCPDTCPRYSAAVVDNVRIKPSPRWLRERLRHCGVRPINNIVDITNYVMLEYGQPMHAFDYAYVNGASITVRLAKEGESIVTLDGENRPLDTHMMVIADEKGPIAVAGVMGGEYSGVYDSTRRIVFESACFEGPSVRGTARRLGMRTESSGRYEKGLNPENAGPALARALELVKELDAGDIVAGVVDCYPRPRAPRTVELQPEAINRLLGIEVPTAEMVDILLPLGFAVSGSTVTVPPERYDVKRYNDLAEEVARFVGYNKIPSTTLRGTADARWSEKQLFEDKIANVLCGYGLWESETFSFYSPKGFDMIRLPETSPLRDAVRLMNPLGEDTSIMRTTALPSILDVVARNWASRNENAALFEAATEYLPAGSEDELPRERKKIVMAAYGEGWDYLGMKGVVEGLLATAGIPAYTVLRNSEGTTWHPGRCADIMIELNEDGSVCQNPLACGGDGRGARAQLRVATVGEIHPAVCKNYGIKPRVAAADVDMDVLFSCRGATPQYSPLPKFPAITRDLAVVADIDTPAQDIALRIRRGAGKNLESLTLFDVYTGEKVEEGKKSMAYSLVLRGRDATLTDADAGKAMDKVLKSLGEIGVEIRQ